MSREGTETTAEGGDRVTGPLVVETADERLTGRAVDFRGQGQFDPGQVAAAVRRGNDTGSAGVRGEGSDIAVRVACPDPGPVHDHVGLVERAMSLRVRTALAAAARSCGLSAPQDDELASVRAQLAELTVPEADTAAARERLAGTESAVAESRERVATLRGRIQAAREAGRDTDDLREELAGATRELSERETERAAAREALDRAERRARAARDARERRRRLEDREANLARDARAHLVDALHEEYAAAVAAVPGSGGFDRDEEGAGPFEVDPVSAALAVGRVATLRAPVVLAVDRFESPSAAADWLDALVVRT